jgi:hypothetical protein
MIGTHEKIVATEVYKRMNAGEPEADISLGMGLHPQRIQDLLAYDIRDSVTVKCDDCWRSFSHYLWPWRRAVMHRCYRCASRIHRKGLRS